MIQLLPAISLWQPWASASASGAKGNETRHWPCPPRYLGKRVAIHAAKRKPRLDEIGEEFEEVCEELTGYAWADLPLGCVVGVVTMVRTYRSEELVRKLLPDDRSDEAITDYGRQEGMTKVEYMLGNYERGRYAWKMADNVKLERPVPCVGRQGFWNLDEVTSSAVRGQLPPVAESGLFARGAA